MERKRFLKISSWAWGSNGPPTSVPAKSLPTILNLRTDSFPGHRRSTPKTGTFRNDQCHADGRDEQRDGAPAAQGPVHRPVDEDREDRGGNHRGDHGGAQGKAEAETEEQGEVGGQGRHVAGGEVREVENAVGEREAGGPQDDDAAEDEAVDVELQDFGQASVYPPRKSWPTSGSDRRSAVR